MALLAGQNIAQNEILKIVEDNWEQDPETGTWKHQGPSDVRKETGMLLEKYANVDLEILLMHPLMHYVEPHDYLFVFADAFRSALNQEEADFMMKEYLQALTDAIW